ncbi:hypothetical protein BH18ACT4_BH18ACT4_01590 [soil metagenome]
MTAAPPRPARAGIHPRRRSLLPLALVGLVLWTASCGLPEDGAPRELEAQRVPFGLLAPSSTTPPDPETAGREVSLYFIEGDQLSPVRRRLADTDPESVLQALIEGKTADDPESLETLIPAETNLLGVRQEDDMLVVNLDDGISTILGDPLRRAFGQFVYTATELAGVNGVQFLVNGDEVDVVTDRGNEPGPVDRGDYVTLRPAADETNTSTLAEEPTTTVVD